MNEKELLEKILEKYHNQGKWNKKSLSEMIDEELAKYNKSVKENIENELYAILGSIYFSNTNDLIAITPTSLSEKLYNNAKDVSKQATQILYENINAKTPIKQLAMKLYEGYDFNEKEVLDIKKKLPKYLQDDIKKKSKTFIKDVEKLKTKPLRIAYKQIYEKLDTMNKEAFDNAIKVAIEEKARYYANRIAKTEIHRARTSKRAMEYLEDDEVEFVKYRMNSKHKIVDICDFYANLDVGYGKGIIPKKEMRTLPLHPHCFCVYEPYYGDVKGKLKEWRSAVNDTMRQFSEYERRQIVGSKSKLIEFEKGEDIEKLFNRLRPKYPIRKYVDIIPKNFKKNYLELNKSGYFDEKFQELDIKDICKKVGIDKKDIDEIIEKTNFEVEGAVYYRNGARFFIKGKKSEVEIPFIKNIEKFIHSHPQGTSFSAIDVELAIENKIPHIVAFNDEYFYSLKIENFDINFDTRFVRIYNIYDKILSDKVQRGEITQSQKDFSINHKIWKKFFEMEGVKYDYYRIRKKI